MFLLVFFSVESGTNPIQLRLIIKKKKKRKKKEKEEEEWIGLDQIRQFDQFEHPKDKW